jgi:hypothetical protein
MIASSNQTNQWSNNKIKQLINQSIILSSSQTNQKFSKCKIWKCVRMQNSLQLGMLSSSVFAAKCLSKDELQACTAHRARRVYLVKFAMENQTQAPAANKELHVNTV